MSQRLPRADRIAGSCADRSGRDDRQRQVPDQQGAIVTDHRVILADVRLHVVEQGEGPVVLLIHGFPETSYAWRHQLPALAAAGYRAVALDVRGYGRSSKPANGEDYPMMELVADTAGLVRALGATTAAVIGHDWGSLIAANAALLEPDLSLIHI